MTDEEKEAGLRAGAELEKRLFGNRRSSEYDLVRERVENAYMEFVQGRLYAGEPPRFVAFSGARHAFLLLASVMAGMGVSAEVIESELRDVCDCCIELALEAARRHGATLGQINTLMTEPPAGSA